MAGVATGRILDTRSYAAAFPSPLAAGAPRISMEADCLRPDLGARYTTLYGDDRAAVVRSARIGKGLAVWWAGNDADRQPRRSTGRDISSCC